MTGLAVAAVAVAAALVLVAIGLLITDARRRRRTSQAVASLQARVAELEKGLDTRPGVATRPTTGDTAARVGPQGRVETSEFVITSIGAEPEPVERVDLTAPAFADAVLRESVVHTASWLAGVRRALSPEVRNRIAFEMRRELKRTRKARKTEVKEALREYRARHRADVEDQTSGLAADVIRAEEAS